MGFLNWFNSDATVIRDKIIYTQRTRLSAIEQELSEVKKLHDKKEDELNRLRDAHERTKERLIEQIVKLSDKFAGLNERSMNVAHENARLKLLLHQKKGK
jgi:predicted  nucleic acid-binding Zn-ribbon protein